MPGSGEFLFSGNEIHSVLPNRPCAESNDDVVTCSGVIADVGEHKVSGVKPLVCVRVFFNLSPDLVVDNSYIFGHSDMLITSKKRENYPAQNVAILAHLIYP